MGTLTWFRRSWRRYERWRFEREVQKLINVSADVMLEAAADRWQVDAIAPDVRLALVREYAAWLTADDSRLAALLAEPVRTLHLFLSSR